MGYDNLGMNKILVPIIVIIVLLLGGTFVFKNMNAKKMVVDTSTHIQKDIANKKTTAFTSIQDALDKSLSLKCDYTMNIPSSAPNVKIISYIKAGNVRTQIY